MITYKYIYKYIQCNEGALLEPAHQGHCVDPRGGKPPPHTVLPVRHAGCMEGPEWYVQAHYIVHLMGRAEEMEISGIGGEGGYCQGFQRLCALPGYGDFLQIPGTFHIGSGT